MFKLKIIERDERKPKNTVFSWSCPLCFDFVIKPNLLDGYVYEKAFEHLTDHHSIEPDRIKVKWKLKRG